MVSFPARKEGLHQYMWDEQMSSQDAFEAFPSHRGQGLDLCYFREGSSYGGGGVGVGPWVTPASLHLEDAATISSVSSVRSSIGIVLNMSEVHRPLAALAGAALYLYIINEIR